MSYLLAIITGILLALPFKFPEVALLEWIALIPLLFALEDKKRRASFYLGWLMGTVFLAVSSHWVIYPLINFSGYSFIICLLIVLVGALFLGLNFGFFTFILKTIEEKNDLSLLILVPVTWTGVEFLRSIFSFQFLFGFLGYSQSFIPELIQLAQYGGVFLVTFVIVVVNTFIYMAIKERKLKYGLIGVLIFVLTFAYGSLELKQSPEYVNEIKVGIVQPSIPQQIKTSSSHQQEVVAKILNLSIQELQKGKPDLLIWPETAILRSYKENRKFPYRFSDGTHLLIGGHIKEGDDYLNSAFLVNQNYDIVNRYSKMNLIPFGEYVPFSALIPDIIKRDMNDLTPGTEYKSFELNGKTWVTAICSEILNPFFINKLYQEDDFMVNISNEAWFERSNAPLQILQAGIFRTVEHRTPLVKVGNTGISGIVDSKGRVIVRTEIFKARTLTHNLKIPKGEKTLYDRVGNLFGGIITLAMFLLLVIKKVVSFEKL